MELYGIPAISITVIVLIILIFYKIFWERCNLAFQTFWTKKANCKNESNAVELNPFVSNEIDPKDIVYYEKCVANIGSLGNVAFAKLRRKDSSEIPIVIKSTNYIIRYPEEKSDAFQRLLDEIQVMEKLGYHINIVGYLGNVTYDIKNFNVSIVYEKCAVNLRTFILNHRLNFSDDIRANTLHTLPKLKSSHLLKWAEDIAAGLEYLHSHGIIHKDIAARNILLGYPWPICDGNVIPGYELVAKISDFHMSTREGEEHKLKLLPIRWMALETLEGKPFSKESDVWAFGVTCWEMFSLGRLPYIDAVPNLQGIFGFLNEGHSLSMPDLVIPELWDVMLKCWNRNLEMRPKAAELKNSLREINLKIMEILKTMLNTGFVTKF